MTDSGVKIEIHLIQNFAPSNLNRDDTGQPKSATFGGYRRARISSQCGKRAVRGWWREQGTVPVGERTKKLQQILLDRLAQDTEVCDRIGEEDRQAGVRLFTDTYYAGADGKRPEHTNVLVFISPREVDACLESLKALWGIDGTAADDFVAAVAAFRGAQAKSAEGARPKAPALKPDRDVQAKIQAAAVSADIALFGRMLAEQPGRNTDGACQVAHPISTHKVDMEMDYFTAVDDLNPREETGAGMMGVVGYNSACYYRYALVDRDQLARNLSRKLERRNGEWAQPLSDEDYAETDVVIRAFLEAMVYAIPTGKQNSFAAQNLPSFGLFVRREGGVPISLANAFSVPVRPSKDDDDLVGLSVAALTKHWAELRSVYGEQGVTATACFHVGQGKRLDELADCCRGTIQNAIDAVVPPGAAR